MFVKQKNDFVMITTICYGEKRVFKSKAMALKFYNDCARNSEGCERDRYLSIVWQIEDGLTEAYDLNPDYFY